ncbi:MAG: N-acetylmuramoyl-L-alanine amidase [Bacilli bacterium]|nr:N-acetylmuramoyl-L-alanine amidase [Bacilli bacterium]
MKHKIYVLFLFFFFLITNVNSKSLPLKDKIIVLDPGHGGVDKGASYYNENESDLVLNISTILKEELEKKGAIVYQTRKGNYDLSSPNTKRRKKSDFDNRIKFINEINPTLIISIHLNASNNNNYNGIQIFYKNNNELAQSISNALNLRRKPVKRNNIYILNNLKYDAFLIEWGFISNYNDLRKIKDKNNIRQTSLKLINGLLKFYDVST